jgi:DNA-binding transcriptional MerR regulator
MALASVFKSPVLRAGQKLKIGEVIDRYPVTRKQLHYWDEIGILRPASIGKYRAYGAEEIDRLKDILRLMSAGYTPNQLRTILAAHDALPEKRMRESEVFEKLLSESIKKEQQLNVGMDWQAYNTAYRRLKRLADQMGLAVFPEKRGETLSFRAKKKR